MPMKPSGEISLVLLLGTNLDDREENLRMGIAAVEQRIGKITRASTIYETEPWGISAQPWFLNQAVRVLTLKKPLEILAITREIEAGFGISKTEKWGPRKLDIDLIFYSDAVLHAPGLIIPHPRLESRRFALVPVSEIAGEFLHPGIGVSVNALLETCRDKLQVRKFKPVS